MNDIVITKFTEVDQTIGVLVGADYVAVRVDFYGSDGTEPATKFDRTLILRPAAAQRLAEALIKATARAREAVRAHRRLTAECESSCEAR